MVEERLFPQHIGGGSYKIIDPPIISNSTKIHENAYRFVRVKDFATKLQWVEKQFHHWWPEARKTVYTGWYH